MGKSSSTRAIVEQDYDSLPGLCGIERDDLARNGNPRRVSSF
jgi:predicted AAA+ superfamily ATPase